MKKFFYTFILLLAALMVPATATADGYERGDATGDGVVNMDDLTTLINYLVYGVWPSDGQHEWVDLGLPSGTLWATCNVGADSPEDYGDYFAWGETAPKEVYNWSTYKWCYGSYKRLTKYCTDSSYGYNGFVDDKTELDPEDDAAYVNWGTSWRMPTEEQQLELAQECTWTWTTQNGVNGRLVTGPNGNTLFLPAAGCRHDDSLVNAGSCGYYYARRLIFDDQTAPYGVYFDSVHISPGIASLRMNGLPVRAVRVLQN